MDRNFLGLDEDVLSYVDAVSTREPAVLAELREETASHPFSIQQITHAQGLFLQLLVKATRAKKIIEAGVFTGYSSLCMALGLPDDGRLIALDTDQESANVARRYWQKAGVAQRVEFRLGPAADSMQALLDEGHSESFDLMFIDADKANYPTYWELGLALLRPGGVMTIDNTLFMGTAACSDEVSLQKRFEAWPEEPRERLVKEALGMRAFNERVRADERVDVVVLPLADGITLAVKR